MVIVEIMLLNFNLKLGEHLYFILFYLYHTEMEIFVFVFNFYYGFIG